MYFSFLPVAQSFFQAKNLSRGIPFLFIQGNRRGYVVRAICRKQAKLSIPAVYRSPSLLSRIPGCLYDDEGRMPRKVSLSTKSRHVWDCRTRLCKTFHLICLLYNRKNAFFYKKLLQNQQLLNPPLQSNILKALTHFRQWFGSSYQQWSVGRRLALAFKREPGLGFGIGWAWHQIRKGPKLSYYLFTFGMLDFDSLGLGREKHCLAQLAQILFEMKCGKVLIKGAIRAKWEYPARSDQQSSSYPAQGFKKKAQVKTRLGVGV